MNIASPAQATTAFCGALHIEVEVSGGDPDFVELFKNDLSLVKLAKPFEYDWDADNVWSRDPIVVTFSEPILESSVALERLQVNVGGSLMPLKSTVLSPDGLTLTLTPDPKSLLPVPATATARLWAMTDRAGNLLPDTSWSWTLPEWQEPAPAYSPIPVESLDGVAAAVGPDGVCFFACSDHLTQHGIRLVQSISGSWKEIAGPFRDSYWPSSFAVDSEGRVVMAYVLPPTVSPSGLQVGRLEGSAWVDLSGPISSSRDRPVLKIDGSNRPVVLWSETVGAVKHLFAKRWNGAVWDSVLAETPMDPTSDVKDYALTVGSGDAVSIAYIASVGGVIFLRGNHKWPPAGSPSATGVDVTGEPGAEVVAFTEGGSVHAVQPVNRNPYSFTWNLLGGAIASGAGAPYLVSRPGGVFGQQLVVGYIDKTSYPGSPHVLGWDGESWNSMSKAIGPVGGPITAGQTGLAVNSTGVMSFSWIEQRGNPSHPDAMVVTRRYNR